jgi:hypothetical protein
MLRRFYFSIRAAQLCLIYLEAGTQNAWKLWLMSYEHDRFDCIKSWISLTIEGWRHLQFWWESASLWLQSSAAVVLPTIARQNGATDGRGLVGLLDKALAQQPYRSSLKGMLYQGPFPPTFIRTSLKVHKVYFPVVVCVLTFCVVGINSNSVLLAENLHRWASLAELSWFSSFPHQLCAVLASR